jgi:haloacetate dehalogenase
MFEGFVERQLPTDRGNVFAKVGGTGPPVLLLHGYPETHLSWGAAADLFARRFTVVAADLPGYGASFKPPTALDHAPHSKRALAMDMVEAMGALGFDRFAVIGHDRGGRVAYRLALDEPGRVTALAVLDVVPTGEVWARAGADMALGYWHWAFLAQPAPLPERLIAGDPDAFFDFHVRALGLGAAPSRYPADLMAAYRALLDDSETVHAMCEDYRAGAGVDREHDDADLGRRWIEPPMLALWSERGALPRFYGDVLKVWRPWARDVTGRAVAASHFLVEDAPELVTAELIAFLDLHLADQGAGTPNDQKGSAMSSDTIDQSEPVDALAATLKRTEIQRKLSSIPGREIVQVRTEIPCGVSSGWHIHPGEEVGYIIAGTVQMEVRDQPTLTLHAGDGFLIPPRVPHSALDLGPGTGQMLSTYIVEIGQPIATFTD